MKVVEWKARKVYEKFRTSLNNNEAYKKKNDFCFLCIPFYSWDKRSFPRLNDIFWRMKSTLRFVSLSSNWWGAATTARCCVCFCFKQSPSVVTDDPNNCDIRFVFGRSGLRKCVHNRAWIAFSKRSNCWDCDNWHFSGKLLHGFSPHRRSTLNNLLTN